MVKDSIYPGVKTRDAPSTLIYAEQLLNFVQLKMRLPVLKTISSRVNVFKMTCPITVFLKSISNNIGVEIKPIFKNSLMKKNLDNFLDAL